MPKQFLTKSVVSKIITTFLTQQAKIILLLLILIAFPTLSIADDFIYDKSYEGSAIGRTENKDGSGYWLLKKEKE